MTATLAHRGPDGSGIWSDAASGVGLGHRRLAIIDLSPAGAQPMISACERFVITYNGELYNAPQLKSDLQARGQRFVGTSDTEVLLAAVSTWGLKEALHRFVGMFAFALWDRKDRVLSLVRDRIGKKPLYWCRKGPLLLFGSELKALMAHPDFRAELDHDAAAAYLRLAYVPSPCCIFAGAEKIAPGSMIQFANDGTQKRTVYWDLAHCAEAGLRSPRNITLPAAIEEADALLRDAAVKRLLSDVPVGVFLSGGVDSSLVTALLQAQLPEPVRTFSVGFEETGYSEAGHARAIASHLRTDHTELTVTAADALDVVPKLSEWFDEPFADSSQIPTHLLAALTRRHVTVALSGDGGDELAAGYVRHGAIGHWWPMVAKWPVGLRRIAAHAISSVSPAMWDNLAALTPAGVRPAHAGDKAGKFASLLCASGPNEIYRSLVSQWARPADLIAGVHEPEGPLDDPSLSERFPDLTGRFQYLDMAGYLPDDVLCKVDRASMAVALEVRSPLLDHRMIELFWSLPRKLMRDGNNRKVLLKAILARYVPPSLFERAKMGFGVPIGNWMRGPLRDWAESLLAEDRLRRENVLDPAPIRQAWDDHLAGRGNHQYRLWTILMFQSWRERWMTQAPSVSSQRSRGTTQVIEAVQYH